MYVVEQIDSHTDRNAVWSFKNYLKAFVISLPPTFEIALSKRLMVLKKVTLKFLV